MPNHPGLGARRTIKDTVAGMMVVAKALRGEALDVPKKRKAPVRTKPRNDMIEKELERQIIFTLQRAGYLVYKTSLGGAYCYNTQYNNPGMADLQVYGLPNKITMLEVKSQKGKQRKAQIEFEVFCNKIGIKYKVVRSVKEALEAINND